MRFSTVQKNCIQDSYGAFKLKQLYHKDLQKFKDVVAYFPFSVHINRVDTFDITFSNSTFVDNAPELRTLRDTGFNYIEHISCPKFLASSIEKANHFKHLNDLDQSCSILQKLRMNGEMQYFYTIKSFLNKDYFINQSYKLDQLGQFGDVMTSIFDQIIHSEEAFYRFQTLTKQEKKIIRLISQEKSREEIAHILFVSTHTVQTHIKNIYRKLDIKKNIELMKFAIALDIIE